MSFSPKQPPWVWLVLASFFFQTEYASVRHKMSFEAFLSQFSSVLSQIKGKANVDFSFKLVQYFDLYQEKPFTYDQHTYCSIIFVTAYCAIACVLCLY